MQIEKPPVRASKPRAGEPVWELARLFPSQGKWSVEEYLALDTGRLIEYSDGFLEFPPMPTMAHQDILQSLFELLKAYVVRHQLGKVYVAPIPVRLSSREYREPDLFFLSTPRVEEAQGKYPSGADLVMEVVSGGREDRKRDLVKKRYDYAQAGIPESGGHPRILDHRPGREGHHRSAAGRGGVCRAWPLRSRRSGDLPSAAGL